MTNFHCMVVFVSCIFGNMWVVINCLPDCDFIKLAISLKFLIKLFLLHDEKSQDKYLDNEKSF